MMPVLAKVEIREVPVPAQPLLHEHPQRLGRVGVSHGARLEAADEVRMPREILLDPQRQIQILGRAAVPPPDATKRLATEDAERAGVVINEIEGIEPRATQ